MINTVAIYIVDKAKDMLDDITIERHSSLLCLPYCAVGQAIG